VVYPFRGKPTTFGSALAVCGCNDAYDASNCLIAPSTSCSSFLASLGKQTEPLERISLKRGYVLPCDSGSFRDKSVNLSLTCRVVNGYSRPVCCFLDSLRRWMMVFSKSTLRRRQKSNHAINVITSNGFQSARAMIRNTALGRKDKW
jgi:hypothetical protein